MVRKLIDATHSLLHIRVIAAQPLFINLLTSRKENVLNSFVGLSNKSSVLCCVMNASKIGKFATFAMISINFTNSTWD